MITAPPEDVFLAPNVPDQKLKNALATCRVPPTEEILILVDATVFGSAKNALLVGHQGVYFHNDWSGETPGAHAVSYERLATHRIGTGPGSHEVDVGPGSMFNTAGSQASNIDVANLLREVQKVMT